MVLRPASALLALPAESSCNVSCVGFTSSDAGALVHGSSARGWAGRSNSIRRLLGDTARCRRSAASDPARAGAGEVGISQSDRRSISARGYGPGARSRDSPA